MSAPRRHFATGNGVSALTAQPQNEAGDCHFERGHEKPQHMGWRTAVLEEGAEQWVKPVRSHDGCGNAAACFRMRSEAACLRHRWMELVCENSALCSMGAVHNIYAKVIFINCKIASSYRICILQQCPWKGSGVSQYISHFQALTSNCGQIPCAVGVIGTAR